MKTIIVTEIDVPDHATDNDISDWVDVEYGQCGAVSLTTRAWKIMAMRLNCSITPGNMRANL
jgi:hypothetical protein